jgi:hypothetical protein
MAPLNYTTWLVAMTVLVLAGCSDKSVVAAQIKHCDGPQPYIIGTTISGRTGEGDCVGVEGSAGQLYAFEVTQPSAIAVTAVTSGFQGFLAIASTDNGAIAVTNANEQGTDLTVRAFVPAGSYRVFVSRLENGDGTFTLTSGPGDVGGCEANRANGVVRGAVINGSMSETDCPSAVTRFDMYGLPLAANQSVTLRLTTARNTQLVVRREGSGADVANRVVPANGSGTVTFTATAAQRYFVEIIALFNAQQPLQLPYTYTLLVE